MFYFILWDVHVPCQEIENCEEAIHSRWEGKIFPEKICQVCNINRAPHGAPGVMIKCYNCSDVTTGCGQVIANVIDFITII